MKAYIAGKQDLFVNKYEIKLIDIPIIKLQEASLPRKADV